MSKFTPFTELNTRIHARLQEVAPALETPFFNGLKLLQHALSYVYSDHAQKLFPNRLHWPFFLLKSYYTLRGTRYQTPEIPRLNPLVFKDSGRRAHRINGETVSIYFNNFLGLLAKISYSHLLAPEAPADSPGDYHLKNLNLVRQTAPDKLEFSVLKALQNMIRKLEKAGMTTEEITQVRSVGHVFFEDFHFYYQLLKDQGVQTLVLTCHYHQEGLIMACKILGIRVIEAQHGLISTNDLYYVYPEYVQDLNADLLFADQLMLYGTYWKDLLMQGSEYTADQLRVVGDYVFKRTDLSDLTDTPKEDAIFIGAQKNLADEYVAYVKSLHATLQAKHPEWKIIIKTHPLEKEVQKYQNLQKLKGIEVHGNEADLSTLLVRSRIQISVYSTTFFDALGLDVVNMSLQEYSPFADYAAEMVKEGIAIPLGLEDDPVELLNSELHMKLTREQVYAAFDAHGAKDILTNSSHS